MAQQIDHPSHYNKKFRKECIEEIEEKYGDEICAIFCLTNAYKYLYRAGAKEGSTKEEDLAKAVWYYKYQLAKLDAVYKPGSLLHSLNRDIYLAVKEML